MFNFITIVFRNISGIRIEKMCFVLLKDMLRQREKIKVQRSLLAKNHWFIFKTCFENICKPIKKIKMMQIVPSSPKQ